MSSGNAVVLAVVAPDSRPPLIVARPTNRLHVFHAGVISVVPMLGSCTAINTQEGFDWLQNSGFQRLLEILCEGRPIRPDLLIAWSATPDGRAITDANCTAAVNAVAFDLPFKGYAHDSALSASSGQIKCQSFGHKSLRVTCLSVAASIATANFTGTGRCPLVQFDKSEECAPMLSASCVAAPRPRASKYWDRFMAHSLA